LVADCSESKSLVLLYRIATVDGDFKAKFEKIEAILEGVPLGKREGVKARGNPELDGYDCIIWTGDALKALVEKGVIDVGNMSIGSSHSVLRHLLVIAGNLLTRC